MKFIALLRGINIGRKNRIKMADLKKLWESMGFKQVKTYLQSGNVIFQNDSAEDDKIPVEIERQIRNAFGYSVKVMVRNEEELESIINNNPFVKDPDTDVDKLHVTFLHQLPDPELVLDLDINKSENEKFEVIGTEIYLYLPNGYARSKLTNNIWGKKFNTIATTRNWKTINKLLEICKSG